MMESIGRRSFGGSGRSVLAFAAFLAVCFAAAGIGGLFTAPQTAPGGWYDTLNKPFFTPPGWLFGPVWTVLYTMIAVSGWLVWRERDKVDVRPALIFFGAQLVLNLLWSVVFFGLEAPGPGLVEILVLWAAISLNIVAFMNVSRVAGWMLVPYLAWVTFAALLNAGIWLLN